jgi:hypothetical protein
MIFSDSRMRLFSISAMLVCEYFEIFVVRLVVWVFDSLAYFNPMLQAWARLVNNDKNDPEEYKISVETESECF